MKEIGKWLDGMGMASLIVWWLVTGMFIGALSPESLGTWTGMFLFVTASSLIYVFWTSRKERLREKRARRFVLAHTELKGAEAAA